MPTVAVHVCNRNRVPHNRASIASAIAAASADVRFVVVDQSGTHETLESQRAFSADPRLTEIASDTTGLCRARNVRVRAGSAECVLMREADCQVRDDCFDRSPTAAIGRMSGVA